MKIIALCPILYLARQYKTGDELPANDDAMVEAWIEAGTAKLVNDKEAFEDALLEEVNTVPIAVPLTAEPGLTGDAINGEVPDNLVGKVPITPQRERKASKK